MPGIVRVSLPACLFHVHSLRPILRWTLPPSANKADEMLSCLFACRWKVLVGETPTLASCGVSVVRYGSGTMVRNALTRASPTREHDRC